MANDRVTTNGNVTVWVVPVASVANYKSPTAAEIATGIDITDAIAWSGTTFPAATASDDIADRSLRDKGNATSRGAAKFDGTLALFRPDPSDTTSVYRTVYEMFRSPRVQVYIITRVLQTTTGVSTPAVAGDWISVYHHLSDGLSNNTDGDDSVKYILSFLPQGEIAVYTQVKNAAAPTVVNATGSASLASATHATAVLRATLGGKPATHAVTWVSSAPNIASVSQNGVVTAQAAGTANITCTHPSATATSTAVVITVT